MAKRKPPPTPPGAREPLKTVLTARFRRDVEKARRSGRDVTKLAALMRAIAERRGLEPARKDHSLRGEWTGCRDCHVEGDWVLIYETTDAAAIFHRTGSHSEVFGR